MISIFEAKMKITEICFSFQKLGKYEFIFLFSEALNLGLSNAFMGKLKSAKHCFWFI